MRQNKEARPVMVPRRRNNGIMKGPETREGRQPTTACNVRTGQGFGEAEVMPGLPCHHPRRVLVHFPDSQGPEGVHQSRSVPWGRGQIEGPTQVTAAFENHDFMIFSEGCEVSS